MICQQQTRIVPGDDDDEADSACFQRDVGTYLKSIVLIMWIPVLSHIGVPVVHRWHKHEHVCAEDFDIVDMMSYAHLCNHFMTKTVFHSRLVGKRLPAYLKNKKTSGGS